MARSLRKARRKLACAFWPPFGVMLSVGLIIEIGHRLAETPERIADMRRLAPLVLFILLNLGLLVHQLGELGARVATRSGPDVDVEQP